MHNNNYYIIQQLLLHDDYDLADDFICVFPEEASGNSRPTLAHIHEHTLDINPFRR